MNQIFILPYNVWDTDQAIRVFDDSESTDNDKILPGGNCYICMDPMCEELEWDTLSFQVSTRDPSVLSIPSYSSVLYTYNGSVIGRFWFDKAEKVSAGVVEITAYSVLEMASTIQMNANYIRSSDAQVTLGGYLAWAWPGFDQSFIDASLINHEARAAWDKGENFLRQLQRRVFAAGGVFSKTKEGRYTISKLGTAGRYAIGDERVFLGGKVEEPLAVASVSVEGCTITYKYSSSSSDSWLLMPWYDYIDTTNVVEYEGVTYTRMVCLLLDKPCYGYYYGNCSIFKFTRGVVWLQSSSTGNAWFRYVPMEAVFSSTTVSNPDVSAGQAVSVQGNYFIKASEAKAYAEKLLIYYTNKRTITMDIVVGDERPGDICEFNDPFGNPEVAILTALDINISKTLRATATFVAGYIPEESLYSNYVIIDADTTWTVPDGVTLIRAVLIGGGDGGAGGGTGGAGASVTDTTAVTKYGGTQTYQPSIFDDKISYTYYRASMAVTGEAAGGAAGKAGAGGRVLSIELAVTAGDSFAISVGEGGKGGAADSAGGNGGNTIFGEYSSADGIRYSAGYTNPLNSDVLGLPGSDGLAGGEGIDSYWDSSTSGEFANGQRSDAVYVDLGTLYNTSLYAGASSAFGGGPSAISNGGDATAGQIVSSSSSGITVICGNGGDGADGGERAPAAGYGYGGDGGHGGGGGGTGGGAGATTRSAGYTITRVGGGEGGKGGKGGTGGKGGDGCVIIYY